MSGVAHDTGVGGRTVSRLMCANAMLQCSQFSNNCCPWSTLSSHPVEADRFDTLVKWRRPTTECAAPPGRRPSHERVGRWPFQSSCHRRGRNPRFGALPWLDSGPLFWRCHHVDCHDCPVFPRVGGLGSPLASYRSFRLVDTDLACSHHRLDRLDLLPGKYRNTQHEPIWPPPASAGLPPGSNSRPATPGPM
jgi:hypothetical protein